MHTESSETRPCSVRSGWQGPFPVLLSKVFIVSEFCLTRCKCLSHCCFRGLRIQWAQFLWHDVIRWAFKGIYKAAWRVVLISKALLTILFSAHDQLFANRWLTLLVSAKATRELRSKSGILFRSTSNNTMKNGGSVNLLVIFSLLTTYPEIFTISSSARRLIYVSVDDLQLAVTQNDLTTQITESKDQINSEID